jgi:hypothetical protein
MGNVSGDTANVIENEDFNRKCGLRKTLLHAFLKQLCFSSSLLSGRFILGSFQFWRWWGHSRSNCPLSSVSCDWFSLCLVLSFLGRRFFRDLLPFNFLR